MPQRGKHPKTMMEVQPKRAAKLKPITTSPNPQAERMTARKSTGSRVSLLMFGKNLRSKNKAISRNGTKSQKIQCHESLARISPVSVGPTAGANMMTSEQAPMAVPSFSGGKMFIATVNMRGRIVPVSIP